MKTINALLLAGACLLGSTFAFGQLEQQHWFFGDKQGLDFLPAGPVFDNAALVNNTISFTESSAVQSDPAGNLLFYSDGYSLWDGNHLLVATNIGGDVSSASGEISVPSPSNPNEYYLFMVNIGPACYRVITDLGGGSVSMGPLTYFPAGGGITSLVGEGITAVAACDHNYWIVLKGQNGAPGQQLVSYALTPAGVSFNSSTTLLLDSYYTSIEAAPNGNRIALGAFNDMTRIELVDFDKFAGTFGTHKLLGSTYDYGSWIYGLSFSPDSKMLYAYEEGAADLFQFDVTKANPAASVQYVGNVMASSIQKRSTLQRGIDDKLYVGRAGDAQLGVIDNPNNRCTTLSPNACNFSNFGPTTGAATAFGLPNLLDAREATAFDGTIDYDVYSCLKVHFTPNICATNMSWNFGEQMSGPNNTSTLKEPWHTYSNPGTYNIMLFADGVPYFLTVTVGYDLSIAGADTMCVAVNDTWVYTMGALAPGQTVNWTASGGTISGPSTDPSVTVVWSTLPGTVTVTLNDPVTGCMETTTLTVYEECPPPPPCDCGLVRSRFHVDEKPCHYTFHLMHNAPACATAIDFDWDFGDGTTWSGPMPPPHMYAFNGVYHVCLTISVTLPDGTVCTDRYCEDVKVTCMPRSAKAPGETTADGMVQEVYPNPAATEVNVRLELEAKAPVTLTLLSLDGKVLHREVRALEAGEQTLQLQLPANTADGMVFLEIQANDQRYLHKLLLKK